MQRPPTSLLVAASLLGALALAAQGAKQQAQPQPGDVVEPSPIVDDTAPEILDAGPLPIDADPAIVVEVEAHAQATPSSGPAAPRADPATASATTDLAPAARPDPTAPRVVSVEPRLDHTRAQLDPDAERAAPASPEPTATPSVPPEGIGFGGVPALNYDADNGFGVGLIANLYFYDGETRPYRASVMLQLFMTTRLVQDHHLSADWLKVGGLPLRLWARVGYLSSLSQNYCGLGGDVSCDPSIAEEEAARQGLVGSAADDFVKRFYLRRFINPYAQLQARWALIEAPARFELTGGFRDGLFIPGTWDDEDADGAPDLTPYPGSLFQRDHPDGEPGFESIAQLGIMLDTRDNEPAPTEGVWLEASARASSPLIGSAWSWGGANLTLRGYAPLDQKRALILCNRLLFDGVVGEPPVQSLVRLGGSNDFYVLGGADLGRGIRAQRFIGKLRVVDTAELRWRFLELDVLGQRFDLSAAGFVDAGLVGRELHDPGPMPLQVGVGGALRLAWNDNFIIRLDVGSSSVEGWAASPYLLIGNPF